MYSCQNDDDFLENQQSDDPVLIDYSKGAKKLENPYTVENMKEAFGNVTKKLNNIKTTGNSKSTALQTSSLQNFEITASHYYIKFKPQTEEQEGVIKRDTTLFLSDYPLDWDFTDEYLDNRPKLPEGKFPEYWVAIPIDKTLPSDVPYEIIEELYIPEEDPNFDTNNNSETSASKNGLSTMSIQTTNDQLLTMLLNEAYTLTDNTDDLLEEMSSANPTTASSDDEKKALWIFGRKWHPSGTLKIWDDNAGTTKTTRKVFSHWQYYPCRDGQILPVRIEPRPENRCRRAVYRYETIETQGKYVPLVGAQVLMRQWFTVRQGITDQNGYFRTGSVRGKARYKIQWERYHYSIRNGSLFQAETRGPKVKKQTWNHNIKGGDDEYHGMIHTAAHIYYYGSRFGLTSPPTNSFWKTQMKIAAREQTGTSSFSHARGDFGLGLLAHIHIKQWGADSDKVFGTTIHELAHAAHQEFDASAYNSLVWKSWISPCAPSAESCDHPGPRGASARRTLETWATTVEILFALNRYRDMFNQPDYEYYFKNRQDLPINSQPFYTSLGYDLIDTINQRIDITPTYSGLYPQDRVSGYTIKQIENSLKNTNSWGEWKEHVKEQNPNNQYIDELFNNWN
jgi:hypothetical protein